MRKDIRDACAKLMIKPKPEIIPTVVPSSFEDVKRSRESIAAFANALHVDAADGTFAPNTTWTPTPDEMLPDHASVFYEAHLMVQHPLSAGVAFARAGAKRIIGHVEAFEHCEQAREAFAMWRKAGAQEIGIGILMATSLEELAPYAALCDSVTLMTISTIGVQGLPFNEESFARVKEAHKRYPALRISVDGGVGPANIKKLAKAGATRFSVGSAISKSADPEATYKALEVAARG